jgi:hypothetical protein
MDNYIINPTTGRPILYNGAIHRRLLRSNQIQPMVIERKQTNSIETKPINVKLSEKKPINSNSGKTEQSESDCDEDSDNSDNTDLQELFNTLNRII